MYHAPSLCFAMSPPIRFAAVTVIAILAISKSAWAKGSCRTESPIKNNDFEVTCSKSPLTAEIRCLPNHSWEKFPSGKFNLLTVNKFILQDCELPQNLSLYNITTSLGLNKVMNIEFYDLHNAPSKKHLSGFQLTGVYFFHSKFSTIPNDLIQEVYVENFTVDHADLTNIPENFFQNTRNPKNIKSLEIIANKLVKIKRNDFTSLENLENLALFDNKIVEIENGAFDKLTNLKVLDMSKNDLKTLPSMIFRYLVSLENIHFSENDFASLPDDLFHINNSKLKSVRFNHNRGELDSIPNGFLKNLNQLNYVELIEMNLTSLPVDTFYEATELHTLYIFRNKLKTLPYGIFETTKSLKYLWIFENELESLPDRLFEDTDLRELYLSHNRLTNINSGLLTGLSNLKVLDVSHNKLSFITKDFANQLQNLTDVDLSHNELILETSFRKSIFYNNGLDLKNVNLSYNKIEGLIEDLVFRGVPTNVNLRGNKISEITAVEINNLPHDTIIDLRENQLQTIDLEDLKTYASEYFEQNSYSRNVQILVNQNPLNCDCHVLEFARYLEEKFDSEVKLFVTIIADDLLCATPPQFKNFPISKVPSKELSCLKELGMTEDDACFNVCLCREYPGKPLLTVDCSYKNLNKLPKKISNFHEWNIELNMSGNNLRETPALNQSYLLNITSLDLSNNNIFTVILKTFSKSLEVLKLHNNNITHLGNTLLTYLSREKILHELSLYNNPWKCKCDANTRQLLSFVQNKSSILSFQEIRCENTDKNLILMTTNELCDTEKWVLIVVISSLTITFFGLVMGVLAALYYKYENEIKVWLYAKQWCLWLITEDELDKDKQYDAFVSYSHKDEDFVEKEIVSNLEEGPNPFKLCLHYRDWLAGEWITDQIARSVEESRRTIVVVSKNFLESEWGRMEFRTAHKQALSEGRARVIVILYGKIGNMQDLDPELKAYLTMNTYVEWGDPWFWDKLRYALPHHYNPRRRTTRNARLIENHLAQMPMNNHQSAEAEVIPMPKIKMTSDDSDKLLESGNEEERMIPAC